MFFFFIAFLIFTGALAVAGYYAWSVPAQEAQEILATRLRELRVSSGMRTRVASDLVRREQRGRLAVLGDFVSWIGMLPRLQLYIEQANLKYRATEVFALCVIIAAVVYFVLGFVGLSFLLLRIGVALGLGALPIVYILRVRRRRLRKFEESLPDAIDLFNRSMKAGHNIHAGLETIAQETFDPIRMEFRKVVEELALGAPIEETLHGLGRRVPLIDLKFFVTGLILQRQTGANMVQVLENLALLVRERLNLVAKIKAATGQQRLSALLLCILPVVVGLGFWILKPEYIELLFTDEVGKMFLTYAVISETIGILLIRKIANPKF
ncbi:MAG TPA: type II secretion system F family protein [Bryobacteraceae bacterium]|nr:type II secretion system F family protein [Bryobacteraceae bacterium]